MRTLRIESLRLVVAAAAAFLLTLPACSSSKTEPDAVACVGEGCPCIFAVECPDGMQCVNGLCSTENPFPEDLRTGDGVADAVGDAVEPDFGPTDQVVEPEVITDLPFGAGCSENAQCASLWCVDSPDGGYCTMLCSEGCPEGWTCKAVAQTSPDYINICVLDKARLCLPCETDLHCGDAGDLCLNIGGGTFCGRDCTLEPCPTG